MFVHNSKGGENCYLHLADNMLISNNWQVKKIYLDSSIIQIENVCTLPCFLQHYFEVDINRRICLHWMSQAVKVTHLNVSNIIYHKFSCAAVSYIFNGKNVNVPFPCINT